MSKLMISICCCICFCSILPVVIILVLAYTVGQPPKCYVQELYIPALDLSLKESITPSNSSSTIDGRIVNPSLFFDLALRNGMKNNYVLYNDIKLTFSHGGNGIATRVIPSFFQWRKDTSYRRILVETRGVPWDGILREVANGSKVVFRVDLETKVRFYWWDSESESFNKGKSKNVRVGTDVEVDGSGMKVHKGYIRLNSAPAN